MPAKKSITSATPTSSHYWADWDPKTHSPHIVRRDTRIYWGPQSCGTVGQCVGTFIGENPGGAVSVPPGYAGYSPMFHGSRPGDSTLRLIFEVWKAAVSTRLSLPKLSDYIEVLNTYYFVDPVSRRSLPSWRANGGCSIYFQYPSLSSRFALLGWGVGLASEPEARALIHHLHRFASVIIPDSKGGAKSLSGSALPCPINPGPVQPSYILQKSKTLKAPYIKSVAALL